MLHGVAGVINSEPNADDAMIGMIVIFTFCLLPIWVFLREFLRQPSVQDPLDLESLSSRGSDSKLRQNGDSRHADHGKWKYEGRLPQHLLGLSNIERCTGGYSATASSWDSDSSTSLGMPCSPNE
mmetsp:Transcript_63255/g.137597  ORF Transcript_63255/g.137597 Transcript_63255/m.137597 type:complete len:125 (-) Transcript_63255:102-476(-)